MIDSQIKGSHLLSFKQVILSCCYLDKFVNQTMFSIIIYIFFELVALSKSVTIYAGPKETFTLKCPKLTDATCIWDFSVQDGNSLRYTSNDSFPDGLNFKEGQTNQSCDLTFRSINASLIGYWKCHNFWYNVQLQSSSVMSITLEPKVQGQMFKKFLILTIFKGNQIDLDRNIIIFPG